jgi:hypothetical protein
MKINIHVDAPWIIFVIFGCWPLYSAVLEIWARRKGWPRGLAGFLAFFLPPFVPLVLWGVLPFEVKMDDEP